MKKQKFGSSLRRLPRPDNVVLVDGLRAVRPLLPQVDLAERLARDGRGRPRVVVVRGRFVLVWREHMVIVWIGRLRSRPKAAHPKVEILRSRPEAAHPKVEQGQPRSRIGRLRLRGLVDIDLELVLIWSMSTNLRIEEVTHTAKASGWAGILPGAKFKAFNLEL